MTFVHGKGTVVILDGNELWAFTDDSSWEDTSDSHEVTCYGARRKAYRYGLGDGKMPMGGFYDDAAAGPKAIIEAIKDAGDLVTLTRRPEGTGTGKPQESVQVLVEKYYETLPAGGMIKWTCDLQMSGDITRTTQ